MSKFAVTVQPQGKGLALFAAYKDRFRHVRQVGPLTIAPAEAQGTPTAPVMPIFTGDNIEVNDILAGFAEAAWATGWRPRGLPQVGLPPG